MHASCQPETAWRPTPLPQTDHTNKGAEGRSTVLHPREGRGTGSRTALCYAPCMWQKGGGVAVAHADARMDLRAITLPMGPDAALTQTR